MQEFFTVLIKNINCTFNYILIINFNFISFAYYTKILMLILVLFIINAAIDSNTIYKLTYDMFIFPVIVRINC